MWLSEPFTRGQAWVDLLILANYKIGYFYLRGNKIEVKRGDLARSEAVLAQRWQWSRGKVRGYLKTLETEQQIIQQKSNIINKITIINYRDYQKEDSRPTNRKTPERHPKDTNNKNKKNKKNKKRDIALKYFDYFWKVFPKQRRGSKDKTFPAFEKSLERDTWENIEKGLVAYVNSKSVKEGFAKGAAAWLNDDRWLDEPVQEIKTTTNQPKGSKIIFPKQRAGAK